MTTLTEEISFAGAEGAKKRPPAGNTPGVCTVVVQSVMDNVVSKEQGEKNTSVRFSGLKCVHSCGQTNTVIGLKSQKEKTWLNPEGWQLHGDH